MDLEEEAVFTEVRNLLEVEPQGPVADHGPDIPALRDQLSVLVSTGKAKEAIGVQLTHQQVKRLSDKDVEKYTKLYETYVGSKTTEKLMDSLIFVATKAVGIEAYQSQSSETTTSSIKSSPLSPGSLL